MDKKALTKILIVVVAGLWIYNIYKTASNFSAEDNSGDNYSYASNSYSPIIFRKDSFQLQLPKVDPFLKNNVYKKQPKQNLNSDLITIDSGDKKNMSRKPAEKAKITWPIIRYYGFVKNHEQNSSLVIVSLNGKNYRVKKGELLENLIIENATIDSITVRMGKDVKSFGKG